MERNENARTAWKSKDRAYRTQRRRCASVVGDYVELPRPPRGRDLGRTLTQEARLATLRPAGLREMRRPDEPPVPPAVAAVIESLGKRPFRFTHAVAREGYRGQVQFAIANSGFAAHWMIERALRCVLEAQAGVQAWRAAA